MNATTPHWSLVNIGSGNGLVPSSHCRSHCWPRSLSPYDVTRPQWVCHCLTKFTHVMLRKHRNCIHIISRHGECGVSWKTSACRTRTGQSYFVNHSSSIPWLLLTWQHMVLSACDYAIPSAKYAWFLLMDAKTRMASLIIMFAVRPICVQDSIFKMSSESPGTDQDGVSFVRIWVKIDVITVPLCITKPKAWPYHDPYLQCYPIPAVQILYSITVMKNKRHSVSNHQLDCLYNSLFRLKIKDTSKLHITGPLRRGIHHWFSVDSPHKGPVISMYDQWIPLTNGQLFGECFQVMRLPFPAGTNCH